jgi:hypothetical protein
MEVTKPYEFIGFGAMEVVTVVHGSGVPSLDRFWPPCLRGWGKIPAPAGPAEFGSRREPGFGPTPGGREAKTGPKMSPLSRVRWLQIYLRLVTHFNC